MVTVILFHNLLFIISKLNRIVLVNFKLFIISVNVYSYDHKNSICFRELTEGYLYNFLDNAAIIWWYNLDLQFCTIFHANWKMKRNWIVWDTARKSYAPSLLIHPKNATSSILKIMHNFKHSFKIILSYTLID